MENSSLVKAHEAIKVYEGDQPSAAVWVSIGVGLTREGCEVALGKGPTKEAAEAAATEAAEAILRERSRTRQMPVITSE